MAEEGSSRPLDAGPAELEALSQLDLELLSVTQEVLEEFHPEAGARAK